MVYYDQVRSDAIKDGIPGTKSSCQLNLVGESDVGQKMQKAGGRIERRFLFTWDEWRWQEGYVQSVPDLVDMRKIPQRSDDSVATLYELGANGAQIHKVADAGTEFPAEQDSSHSVLSLFLIMRRLISGRVFANVPRNSLRPIEQRAIAFIRICEIIKGGGSSTDSKLPLSRLIVKLKE